METSNLMIIVAAVLALSEALALIPSVKANSVFQLIVNILSAFAGSKEDKK